MSIADCSVLFLQAPAASVCLQFYPGATAGPVWPAQGLTTLGAGVHMGPMPTCGHVSLAVHSCRNEEAAALTRALREMRSAQGTPGG